MGSGTERFEVASRVKVPDGPESSEKQSFPDRRVRRAMSINAFVEAFVSETAEIKYGEQTLTVPVRWVPSRKKAWTSGNSEPKRAWSRSTRRS